MGEIQLTINSITGTVAPRPLVIEMIDDDMVAIMRSKTISQKMAILNDAHRTARKLVRCGVQMQHADWSSQQVEAEVSRRLLHGSGTFSR